MTINHLTLTLEPNDETGEQYLKEDESHMQSEGREMKREARI